MPHSNICDTSRPRIGQRAAIRADLGGKPFIHFFVPSTVRNRFVAEHVSEGGPASIQHRFCHGRFDQGSSVDVANCDVVKLTDYARRELMVEIVSSARNSRVNLCRLTALASSLGYGQLISQFGQVPRVGNLFASGQGCKVFQAKIDANAIHGLSSITIWYFDGYVEEPIAASIAGKVCPVLDFSLREGARMEDAKGISSKPEGIPLSFQMMTSKRNPAKGTFATVAQEWQTFLKTALCVLIAHRIDRARIQPQFLAAACGQVVEVKPGEPFASPLQSILLAVIAVIKNKIDRPGLLIQQAIQ